MHQQKLPVAARNFLRKSVTQSQYLISQKGHHAFGIREMGAYVRFQKPKSLDSTYFDKGIVGVIAQQHVARAQARVSGTVAAVPEPSPGLFWLTYPVD
jgi:hypothetical protein